MRKFIYGLLFIFLLAVSNLSYSAYSYYGPTLENEHLYRIALKVRPTPRLTIQQMMIAILYANPSAFNNNNINGLKSGYKLRLPSVGAIERISPDDALKIVNTQNQHWMKTTDHRLKAVMKGTKYRQFLKPQKALKPSTTKKIKDQIPSIENSESVAVSSDSQPKSEDVPTKTSVTDLVNQQQVTATPREQAQLPTPTLNIASSDSQIDATHTQQATHQLNEKLNSLMTDNQKFQQQTNNALMQLAQQNKSLEGKVNQLSEELRSLTYHFIQLTASNQQPKSKSLALIDNLKKNALGLSTGLLALILLTYLLVRSFRGKRVKTSSKEDMSIPSKLDLARAYMDMGDHSSAKTVLKEVIAKGNAEQKKNASDLMGKMNSSK